MFEAETGQDMLVKTFRQHRFRHADRQILRARRGGKSQQKRQCCNRSLQRELEPPCRSEIIPLSHQIKDLYEKEEDAMSEEAFNMSLRKFLKTVGVTSQREIEE